MLDLGYGGALYFVLKCVVTFLLSLFVDRCLTMCFPHILFVSPIVVMRLSIPSSHCLLRFVLRLAFLPYSCFQPSGLSHLTFLNLLSSLTVHDHELSFYAML